MSGAEWAGFLAVGLGVCELAQHVDWARKLHQVRLGQRAMWRVARHRSAGDDRRSQALLAAARRLGGASLSLLVWLLTLLLPLLLVAVAASFYWVRPGLLADLLSPVPTMALLALAVVYHLARRRFGRR